MEIRQQMINWFSITTKQKAVEPSECTKHLNLVEKSAYIIDIKKYKIGVPWEVWGDRKSTT